VGLVVVLQGVDGSTSALTYDGTSWSAPLPIHTGAA
jgi:hypothetical protein